MFFNNSCCCDDNSWQQESCCCNMNPCCNTPIVEQPIERCVERRICHRVDHVCPIHTRVINNHVYEHTYRPEYTTSEENIVTNIDNGSCGNFL